MKYPKISQSFIKAYVDYLNEKECGLYFKANHIDKDPTAQREPSDAMRAGMFFEYLCTGALPKSGQVPEPDMVYKGTAREKMSAPYERAVESSKVFKKIIDHYGIKIKEVGMMLQTDELSGVVDIYAEWDGQDVFIDLKYTGLIDDKWNEMGWETDSLHMKDSLMIQGVHYKLLAEKCLKIPNIPFYYFVFSSSDVNNVKIIRQEVDESKMQSHVSAIHNIFSKLDTDLNNGFIPYPTLVRCSNCPLSHKCLHKLDVPLIDKVYY